MIEKLGLLCLIAATTFGCAGIEQWDELRGAERKELPPIKVGDKTYKIVEFSRAAEWRRPDRNNPADTFAIYAVVGPGKQIYCGSSVSQCDAAIREFLEGPKKPKANKKPVKAEKEVLDGM
jgi:hypothetical protein